MVVIRSKKQEQGGRLRFIKSLLPLYAAAVTGALVLKLSEDKALECFLSTASSTPWSQYVQTPAAVAASSSNGVYQPVDCAQFVQHTDVDTDPTGLEKVLVRTQTKKSFLIALHKKEHDKVRWDILRHGRYYEWNLEDIWSRLLSQAPPGSHVVDVGGNIGYYSLFSASLGNFVIDSFEPNPSNILRFCESIGINYWDAYINIWEMGVSNLKGELNFVPDLLNPGASHFVSSSAKAAGMVEIPVTTLDDFARDRGYFETRPNIAILKIDVERHEAQVLQGAKEFLNSGMLQNIFIELGAEGKRSDQIAALTILTDAGYQLAGQGNFRGPKDPSLWPNDAKLAENIMNHLESKGNTAYLNLWWSLGSPK